MSSEMRRRYTNATSVILESGTLYTLFVSIHFALFARGSAAAPVISYPFLFVSSFELMGRQIIFAAVSQIVVNI
ncbi:hypothetical protein C8J57DRAFT_1374072, partial [Mycena rebaudengoi]